MSLSVCIPTWRRPAQLAMLLEDLAAQTLAPDEVVVVDNDPEGSAREVVAQARGLRAVRYDIQPVKSISRTRNRTLELASGEWLAFIDDDERAPPRWLELMMATAADARADGVQAPVLRVVPDDAPAWIRRGDFYSHRRLPTGTVVPPKEFFIGNFLLRAAVAREAGVRFDERYGLTGGEDGDFMSRLVLAGARIVWCDEAACSEPVEPRRLQLRWLAARALRGGQDYARHLLGGRYGPPGRLATLKLAANSGGQLAVSSLLAVLALPAGRHRSAAWLLRGAANAGKLSALWGAHYREYA